MDRAFWERMWQRPRPGFHWDIPQPLLLRHWPALGLAPGARVFVPLCGKSLDLGWLAAQGFRVVGVELVRGAVEAFFAEQGLVPNKTAEGSLVRLAAGSVEIWAGDIFDLTAAMLGPVDAVYDRAALIALPEPLRARYAAHLVAIAGPVPHLLLTFRDGRGPQESPPFRVAPDEIARLYRPTHRLVPLPPDMGPDEPWLLQPLG
jgi:thiopurine S-methyltransferase